MDGWTVPEVSRPRELTEGTGSVGVGSSPTASDSTDLLGTQTST